MVTDQPSHDAWFRARVQEALADPRPSIPHDEVEAHMARRRQTLRQRLNERSS
ncbi:stability determinant (plasmid) [Tistrella bauzanensis]|jgi:DNA-damage-inducible protein J|uniref:type II toxin-antitoxin system RelB family antitoxin n=1 Tax=Tistrella bauzanensis TaxID=657419 RepID=UPI0031FA645B